jgi:hypothetical protein
MSDPPPFCARVDRPLAAVAGRVRMLGAVAPLNAAAERARVLAAFAAGDEARPTWTYARSDLEGVFEGLDAIARVVDDAHPLGRVYLARIRELVLEARIANAAGTRELASLARERFAVDAGEGRDALATARAWIGSPRDPAPGATRTSDGPEPESLASRLRAELGARRLPFVVEVRADLVSLAATGEQAVYVAKGREMTDEDVRRTVLHEVDGHVLPRVRAASSEPWIFRIGTARGTCDQEGFALLLEERAGLLGSARKRTLAARHLACAAMEEGATFVECVRELVAGHAVPARDAVLVAERAYRGGDGVLAGLGRERVYLARLARVRARLTSRPADETILANGQVAVDALDAVRPYVGAGTRLTD